MKQQRWYTCTTLPYDSYDGEDTMNEFEKEDAHGTAVVDSTS